MNNDFKYVLHDLTNIYIGAKYTYDELVDLDDLPFKFRMTLANYVVRELDGSMTLGEHVLSLKKEDMAYKIYKQIKAKFKLNIFMEDGHGRGKPGYVQKEIKIQDMIEGKDAEWLHANKDTIFVEEMHITTLGLMAI